MDLAASAVAANEAGYSDNVGELISHCQLRTARAQCSGFGDDPTFICNANQAVDYLPGIQRIASKVNI